MLSLVDRIWEKFLWCLMALASLYVGLIMVAIIYMTTSRAMGWSYNPMTFTFIEYGFLYIMFLGSPWLIRTRSHVYIEMLTAAVPDKVRILLSRLICLTGAAVCLIWAWYTFRIFLEQWDDPMAFDELRAQFDLRLWVSTAIFPIGFLLMSIEFLRFVFTAEPMHTGLAGVASDRAELEETKRTLIAEQSTSSKAGGQ
ncbi:MAG: TRAP transporter small permease [Alphaproteobacteria bacterium]|nr:TRAP transporter small permease [Alphaproteobacteria bacterium]MBT4019582.1 TRAP transporter small permease [Alphaproteobacteria bacterium]MBT5158272.1 TRAP transporter small permease [Alphaproteobacteria bacterium]MBT5919932.1 TRAP transporter small permease [Alphaproteobacteria bacterium]MBT6386737.1 TRAP transporter small permease [Alphaproteobacteria bacterium]